MHHLEWVDNIHCFQLAHDILNSLRSTERQWLVDLLFAFNSGNIGQFEQLRGQWGAQVRTWSIWRLTLKLHLQPDLAKHERHMKQKIALLCLMEMTFRRPANQRQLDFNEISAETGLQLNEVSGCVTSRCRAKLSGGAVGDEGAVAGPRQRVDWRSGGQSSHDVGAATGAGQTTGI